MTESMARELELLRQALELPTVGVTQAGDLEQLRLLVRRYPAQARGFLAELGPKR